ncbi:hypothetical protein P3S59_26170, partial [Enterobacter hormaechei]|nr:hypothetical protein [Enterobacter hormaechei]
MPRIYNSLIVKDNDTTGQPISVTCEVQQLLGNNKVRAVAMSATDGLMRGMKVIDTGGPLSVPVGETTLGRIFNVLGEPVDNLGPVDALTTSPIHRSITQVCHFCKKRDTWRSCERNFLMAITETNIKEIFSNLAPHRATQNIISYTHVSKGVVNPI